MQFNPHSKDVPDLGSANAVKMVEAESGSPTWKFTQYVTSYAVVDRCHGGEERSGNILLAFWCQQTAVRCKSFVLRLMLNVQVFW